ncbi:uncharacterized protein LOC125583168 [Brassica napus]|uniref:uncharacterized protein LOC125583168 n=1 Tax=Brassica napus TaxID=3708 RepID=UPI00207AC7B5|nr:uncharacterized protein LOC125583168 [Brassica napus]
MGQMHCISLNPAKCRYAVESGEFLSYLVTYRGIEVNPKQIGALIDMASPKNKREVQRLTGRVTTLNRFISRSTDKCLPFYDILRGNKKFEWNGFQQLKHYLATPPVLAKPVEGEPLFSYIVVSATAVSSVLIIEKSGEHEPIFYLSKTLLDAESQYPLMEKLAYAVVTSARKLRPYFQSHTIVILTTFPLRTILHSPSQSGRLAKWAVELSEYDIECRPRTSAKSQVLSDFLVELPTGTMTNKEPNSTWVLHVDRSSSKQGSGIKIRLKSPTNEILEQSFRLEFHASNKEDEYEALIAGLPLAHKLKIRNIHAYYDSQLVVNFDCIALTRIPRSENVQADALAALASSSDPGLKRVIPVEFIEHPSIGPPIVINLIGDQDDDVEEIAVQLEERSEQSDYGCDTPWLETIRAYIIDGKLPPEKWAARKIRTQAARYVTVDGEIYKWKFFGPLMKCLEGEKAKKVMEEVHSGSCGNNSGGRHRVPYEIATDNRSQFISTRFEAFCEKWKIPLNKSTPRYPQCNGQAETINKTVLDEYKKCLDAKKGRWGEELEGVLWSHRTTPRRATGETHFALVYGTECLIPAEVKFPRVRRRLLPEREELNNAMLLYNLDLINENQDQALIRIQNYQHAAAKYYNSNVRNL